MNMKINLDVVYVPIPEERLGAWRASLSLLLDLLYEERDLYQAEQANKHSTNEQRKQLGVKLSER